jgi:hypothetical protein
MRRPSSRRACGFGDEGRDADLLGGISFEKECQALQKDSKAYWDALRGRSSLEITSHSTCTNVTRSHDGRADSNSGNS